MFRSGFAIDPAMPTVALAADTGSVNNDWISGNGQLNVTLETDAIWYYSLNGGATFTQGSGASFTLEEGTYLANSIQVYQVDKAGNQSDVWQSPQVQIITTPPEVKTVQLKSGYDTGLSDTDMVTNKQTLVFEGTVEGSVEKVTVTLNGAAENVDVTGSTWEYAAPANLAAGEYTFTIYATDIAGNVSETVSKPVVIDTTKPDAPTGIVLTTDSGTQGDNKTNVAKPTFQGTAEANAQVKMVFDLGNSVTKTYTTTADNSGSWSLTVSEDLPDGPFSYIATTTDVAGNESDCRYR